MPLHLHERSKRKLKARNISTKKAKNKIEEEVQFIKQVPVHPRYRQKRTSQKRPCIHSKDRLKRKIQQTATENSKSLIKGKFNFKPEKILKKSPV